MLNLSHIYGILLNAVQTNLENQFGIKLCFCFNVYRLMHRVDKGKFA